MRIIKVSNYSPVPWSFSKYKAFNTCPEQFYHERVLKLYPQEETAAMLYGTLFHEAAENYVRDGTPLPKKFDYAKDALDLLIAMPGDKLCEQKMGVTASLEPCEFDAKEVWWRGIADINIINGKEARSIDYKTGSAKSVLYADTGQLELIALAIFTHYPEVDVVKAALLYVVAKRIVKDTYRRDQLPALWGKWITNYNRMHSAYKTGVWNTKQSGLCYKHCPVLDCPHNGRN